MPSEIVGDPTVVRVVVHLESAPEFHQVVWWADSPDLDGFSAAADHLAELVDNIQRAVAEIVSPEAEVEYDIRQLDGVPRDDGGSVSAPSSDADAGMVVRQVHRVA